MANIVVTSTANCVILDNGVYVGTAGPFGIIQKTTGFPKDVFWRVAREPNDTYVEVKYKHTTEVSRLSYDGSGGTIIVDLINGVAPTSNQDLWEKLMALLG